MAANAEKRDIQQAEQLIEVLGLDAENLKTILPGPSILEKPKTEEMRQLIRKTADYIMAAGASGVSAVRAPHLFQLIYKKPHVALPEKFLGSIAGKRLLERDKNKVLPSKKRRRNEDLGW